MVLSEEALIVKSLCPSKVNSPVFVLFCPTTFLFAFLITLSLWKERNYDFQLEFKIEAILVRLSVVSSFLLLRPLLCPLSITNVLFGKNKLRDVTTTVLLGAPKYIWAERIE